MRTARFRHLFAAALGAAALVAAAPAGAAAKPSLTKLSDEQRVTYWAHAVARWPVRRRHDGRSHGIVRLHYDTEDHFREVYLVLARYVDADGRKWLRVRLPMRPNGRVGWVRRQALGRLHLVRTFLEVDRSRLRARLFRRGRVIWRARVGIGRPGAPTPPGRFWIREKFRVRASGTIYGPYAFGTADYSRLSDWPRGGVVGVHGTNEPGLIPGRPSHGCIRLRNSRITRLWRLMPIGTPLHITR
jgi:hypothetical protein